jgi:hypothetical protein
MHAYATVGWEELFLAEAGASAALAGLLFVAISMVPSSRWCKSRRA